MIFRTKVLGGGGYNDAKNDSITSQNSEECCRNLQDTSIKSQKQKSVGIKQNSKMTLARQICKCFFAFMLLMFLLLFNVYFYFSASAPNINIASADYNRYCVGIKCAHEKITPEGVDSQFCVCGALDGAWNCSHVVGVIYSYYLTKRGGYLYHETSIGSSVTIPIEQLKLISGTGYGFKLTARVGESTKTFTEKSTDTILSGYSASDFTYDGEDTEGYSYYILWVDFERTTPTYDITCNNTGTGGTTTTTVTSVSTTTITAGTKTGYDFTGWTGDLANSNATFTIDGSTLSGDITLTANWKAQVYTITYNYTGDLANDDKLTTDWGGKTAPTTHTYDSATSLVLPSRARYTFDGWYTNSACAGTALSSLSATGYTANITLYGKWTKTHSLMTINISVTGASGNGVILYLLKDGKVQSQIVATNGKEIVLTQSVGENYAILVSKPYMWTMTVSGDCTLDTANKNKITYTITKDNKNITLTFSGGASSSMICV